MLTRTDDRAVRRAFQELAWDVVCEFGLPYAATPLVMSRAHFERLKGLEARLALDILNEGQIV